MRHSRGTADTLTAQTSLAGWASPKTRDFKSASASPEFLAEQMAHPRGKDLSVEVTLAGWATPNCPAPHDSDETAGRARPREGYGLDLPIQANLAGWPSPCTPNGGRSMSTEAMDATGKTADGKKHTASLEHAVKFAGWPTPMAGTPAQKGYNEAGNTDSSRKTVDLVSFPAPTSLDAGMSSTDGIAAQPVTECVTFSAWPTPSTEDYKRDEWSEIALREAVDLKTAAPATSQRLRSFAQLSGPVRLTASGEMLTGSDAAMESSGQLNPEHSLWLQAIPAVWASYGLRATQSMSQRRSRSSKPTSKRSVAE
jgi:hypothetical protein